MPGISLVVDFKGGMPEKKGTVLRSLDALLHSPDYTKKILLDQNFYLLGCTQYEHYPLTCFENSSFQIYLEGQIYDKDPALLDKELNRLASCVFQNHSDSDDRTKEWLLNADGDFVVFILRKEFGEIAILNDVLGRLPLYSYYSRTDGEFILSRELRFITNVKKNADFDRMAIAQFLLLGHPLGERTLLEDIHHVRPASIIKICPRTSQIRVQGLRCLDFESKPYADKGIRENATELVSRFSQACVDRAHSESKNVLALSGGLDSRSVAAGLWKNKIPFSAATMEMDQSFAADVKIAAELSRVFNIDWQMFDLDAPRGKDCLKLLRMKAGLN
ncbi:MAG: hypothetical protein ACREQW_02160, partial [Candidatus Binatia bacterium]